MVLLALLAALPLAACAKPAPIEPPGLSHGATPPTAAAPEGADTIPTSKGDVIIHPVYHASVWFEFGGKVIAVDPWSKGGARFEAMPKADFVLITDIHPDHFDPPALERVKKAGTVVIAPQVVADKLPGAVVMKNGEKKDLGLFGVEAIPMYNLKRGPEPGKLFHDKGRGNGYVLTLGDHRFYLSGDTECTDEMKALTAIDVAFVCMNVPYTMPPAEAAECVKAFQPRILYPYHYRDSNLADLQGALVGVKTTEIRERTWY
jgi:L-ascorbate metabolism protein UlaG (beta-lactamase superfamily)